MTWNRIRQCRLKRGMTQRKLAKKLFITPQTLLTYEKGKSNLLVDRVEDLAKALDVNPSYLVGWSDDPTPKEVNR